MMYQPFPPWGAVNGLFGQLVEWFRSPPPSPDTDEDLRICRFCGLPYVGPLDRNAEGTEFRILLRCGNATAGGACS